MRQILVADDDVSIRKSFVLALEDSGCRVDTAAAGNDCIELARKVRYDLICLDIMMLEMNGHETLKAIREIEEADGIYGLNGVKVPMTTALDDPKNILGAFRSQCEAYLVKPIEKQRLVKELGNHGLLGDSAG